MDTEAIDTLIAGLGEIQGFDCQEGILRIFGNKALYCRLIIAFFSSGRMEALRLALGCGDNARAVGEAHAMKGAALNMGFHSIASLSGAIETSLRHGQAGQTGEPLRQLEEVFSRVMARLPRQTRDE